jgi:8-oxo-dGTP pyrophosphatase MutT (NUDIX family)
VRSPTEILAELDALDRPAGGAALVPRDAATLIVLDRGRGEVRMLMGRRHRRHRFMPGALVFPGGRVDPTDGRVPVADDLSCEVAARLMVEVRGGHSMRRARGLAVAAIRETFEETGLLIGRPAPDLATLARAARLGEGFSGFVEAGLLPALAEVRFVARAITPPGLSRRFDTRFFAVPATAVVGGFGRIAPSDELEGVDFVSFREARADPALAPITRAVVDELERRLGHDPGLVADPPIPFYRWRHGRSERRELDGPSLP